MTAVFAGPSLPQTHRIVCPQLTYLPPAARGDVLEAAEHFDAVLLIDGAFHHDLAPAPKEVYAATQRASVFGAASMGALRAAECARYGMVPLGIIARWYACGYVDGDDEVAVLVDPRTQTALTVPMVNVRYVAWLARRRGLLSRDEVADVYRRSRGVYYMERTWDDVYETVPPRARAAFRDLAERYGELKRHDAVFALRTVLRRYNRPHAIV
jgi:hypothetical protein